MLKATLIAVLFATLINLAWFVPLDGKPKAVKTPTLMISLDGLRADKLDKFLTENPESYLKRFFVEQGVKAEYMKPSFPTLTFPNHYTLVTGLFQESHGIVGNTLYDPNLDKKVNFLSSADALDVKYWDGAEPLWLTAKKQGLKTASFFWTGSEVWTRHPDVFLMYTTTYKFLERCEEVTNWFAKFEMDFVTLYFNEPDHTGHAYGADSNEYYQKIQEVDDAIGYLITLLLRKNLLDKINILVVSDHGMTDMKSTYLVKDYVNVNLINATKTVYGIVSNIHPINENVKEEIYNGLKKIPEMRVFYKEEIPAELNFQMNDRIGPIVAIANEGYVMNTQTQTLKANHGFDNSVVAMRAAFLARGPDFKENVQIAPIKNVDVYPLLCELCSVRCNPHNGTISAFANAINFIPRYEH